MSDAGSACATLPPIVPRLRTCRSPIPRAHSAIAARAGRCEDSGDASSSQVVSGPMWSSPSRSSIPRSSSREMSTTSDGRAIRSFITGTSDCPPAIAFASGSAEELERVVEVGRPRVARRGGDHEAAPRARIDSTIPW